MTCFRDAKGKSIHSQCKSSAQYGRFVAAVEKGLTVAEAFKKSKKPLLRGHPYGHDAEKIQSLVDNYSEAVYKIVKNCCKRKKVTLEQAILWAARTQRITIKRHKKREVFGYDK